MKLNNVMDGYSITESQIELIAMLLILKNGSTTNLDIKEMFRASGFNATQQEISLGMTSLESQGFFTSSVKTNHRIYVIPYDRMNELFLSKNTGTAPPYGQPTSIPASNTFSVINSRRNGTGTHQTILPTYKSTSIIADPTKKYDGCWLVTDKDNISSVHIHKTLTRSQARTKFAKEFGVHYNNVRCKRVKVK